MGSLDTIQRHDRSGWTLMNAIHDALRRDMDALLHPAASGAAARARWIMFRDQLRFHLAAEHAAIWRPARAKLTGDVHGEALLEAMEDEHRLIGPLVAVTDDAFTMDDDPGRLRELLTRLRIRVSSHLAHEEADALPLIGAIMPQRELDGISRALRGGNDLRRTALTVPWALAHASPGLRNQVLGQLPWPTRLLCQKVWLPRYPNKTASVKRTRPARPARRAAADQ